MSGFGINLGHDVDPVPVDLLVTGEVVGYICRECLRPCSKGGRHLAPAFGTG